MKTRPIHASSMRRPLGGLSARILHGGGRLLYAWVCAVLVVPFPLLAGPDLSQVEVRQKTDPNPPTNLAPRPPLPQAKPFLPEVGSDYVILVKFRDEVAARVTTEGRLSLLETQPSQGLVDILSNDTGALEPVFDGALDPQGWEVLIARAESRTGRQQPDFFGLIHFVPLDLNPANVLKVAGKLNELPEVEMVEIEARDQKAELPIDIPPTTPDLEINQAWRRASPGLDADYGRLHNALGQGTRFIDVEQGILDLHEDNPERYFYIQTSPPSGGTDHGTAVMSIVAAPDNGYGVTGFAPETHARFASTMIDGARRAVRLAATMARAGDVVLYEMAWDVFDDGAENADLAVTTMASIWMLTRTLADSGVIVIEAAGNGNINLDGTALDRLARWRSWGPSGSILVGAGSANDTHQRLGFSCYGSMVDVHAWGESVAAAGYGNLFNAAPDTRQDYTRVFNGTSSASALVAGACTSLQSLALAHLGRKLELEEMRSLLVNTGIPQGGDTSQHIGPMVNLRRAIDSLIRPLPRSVTVTEPYQQSFPIGTYTGGYPMPPHGWVIKAEPETGRTRIFGGRLRMDTTGTSGGGRLNEATLHLRLAGRRNVILYFQHRHMNDEVDSMPPTFVGWADADGVAFSADGVTYYKLTDFAGEPSGVLNDYVINLDAAVAAAGVSYTDNFRIRLQQFGSEPWGGDGREFDNLRVAIEGPGVFSVVARRGDEVMEGDVGYVTVQRQDGATEAVTVDVRTRFNTASAADFDLTHGSTILGTTHTLAFGVGVAERTLAVRAHADGLPEGRESFRIQLENPAGGASLGLRNDVLITILDSHATDWSKHQKAEPVEGVGIGDFLDHGPRPDELRVVGLLDRIVGLRVRLDSVTSPSPERLHIWLEAPDGRNILLMSGATGFGPLENTDLIFDGRGMQSPPPNGPQDGIYQPQVGGAVPNYLPKIDATLHNFAGADVNGVWKLFVLTAKDGMPVALEGGWALSFITAPYPEITGFILDANQTVRLTFLGVPGGFYQLEGADSLKQFGVAQPQFKGQGAFTTLSFPKPANADRQFYRIEELSIPPLETLY